VLTQNNFGSLAQTRRRDSAELSEILDGLAVREVLINALIDLGRVERVPSENLVSKKSAQYTITNGSQEASPDVVFLRELLAWDLH
jgi:hypothetical protein